MAQIIMKRNSMNSSACTLDDVVDVDVGSNHSYDLSNEDDDDDDDDDDDENNEDKQNEKYLEKLLDKIDKIVFDQEECQDFTDIPVNLLSEIQLWQWKFRTKRDANLNRVSRTYEKSPPSSQRSKQNTAAAAIRSLDNGNREMKEKTLPKLSIKNNTKRIERISFLNNETQRRDIGSTGKQITLPPLSISKQTRCPTGYIIMNENPDYIRPEFGRKASLAINGFDGLTTSNITKTTSLYFDSPVSSSSLSSLSTSSSIQKHSPMISPLFHHRRNSSLRQSRIDLLNQNNNNNNNDHLRLRLPILNNNNNHNHNLVSPFYNNG